MARRVFYTFHYEPDCARAARVRNMGVVEGNKPATDNDWERITNGGDKAIQRWIDDQLYGKSCNVVGRNPFEPFTMKGSGKRLSSIVNAYNPPYTNSKDVYACISDNLEDWIEEAIEIRNNYEG